MILTPPLTYCRRVLKSDNTEHGRGSCVTWVTPETAVGKSATQEILDMAELPSILVPQAVTPATPPAA